MKCPRTGSELREIEIEGVRVDYSEACGGVWLDNYELMKFDEAHEGAGAQLAELTGKAGPEGFDPSQRLKCPKDPDFVMARRFYSAKAQVEIDECPLCGGIWLDAGELSRIREMFPTEESMRKANEEHATAVFEKAGFTDQQRNLEANKADGEKTSRIFNFLRWMSPGR